MKIAERYPDGEFFREKAARELFMTNGKDEGFDEKFKAYTDRFPPEKFADSFVEDNMFEHYNSNIFRMYIYNSIIGKSDYSRLVECLGTSPRGNLATYFWHLIQIPYKRGDVPAGQLYPYAKMIYSEMQSRPRTKKEMVWSPREWRDMFYSTNRNAMDDARVKKAGIEFDHFRYSIYMYAQQATTPWYRFLIRYDPAVYLSKVKVPVLAINGTKDVMVNCRQNLDNVRKYLAHNKNVTVVAIPDMNHLLLPCSTGTQDEYAKIDAPVSSDALEIIYNWIETEIGL